MYSNIRRHKPAKQKPERKRQTEERLQKMGGGMDQQEMRTMVVKVAVALAVAEVLLA
jgi:hypothetical protein